jgi:hypothetical protein
MKLIYANSFITVKNKRRLFIDYVYVKHLDEVLSYIRISNGYHACFLLKLDWNVIQISYILARRAA